MNYELFQIFIDNLVKDSLGFANSTTFLVIKILLGIYASVLVADLILLIIQRNVISNFREGFSIGMNVPPELTTRKKKLKATWMKLKASLEGDNESKYKVTIIEADNLINDLLAKIGFEGENMGERLDNIQPGQLDNAEALQTAHAVRNKIIHEEDFKLSQAEAKETMALYEKFLDYFGVLD